MGVPLGFTAGVTGLVIGGGDVGGVGVLGMSAKFGSGRGGVVGGGGGGGAVVDPASERYADRGSDGASTPRAAVLGGGARFSLGVPAGGGCIYDGATDGGRAGAGRGFDQASIPGIS